MAASRRSGAIRSGSFTLRRLVSIEDRAEMSIKPEAPVCREIAQRIVDRAVPGRPLIGVSKRMAAKSLRRTRSCWQEISRL
jgi:hypothetical protein